MSAITITLEVPENLINRAKVVGMELENQPEPIIAALEAQIRKREAFQRFDESLSESVF